MKHSARIRVIQFGLGAIGLATARLVGTRPALRLVGAVEADAVRREASPLAVPSAGTLSELQRNVRADMVLHTTGSRLVAVQAQLEEIIEAGLPCISSAEELFFPIGKNVSLARKLDALARRRGVVVVGTGVNPGFVMDLLPVILSATCQRIQRLFIRRTVDVSTRRVQLQRKVGIGLTRREFRALSQQGRLGHVGLRESAMFVASALGWKLDEVSETTAPVFGHGRVLGIHQFIRGTRRGRKILTLELQMAAGADDPKDEIRIEGEPPLHLVIPGGIRGDQATAALLVNSIPLVLEAEPGLRSVLDLRLPRLRA